MDTELSFPQSYNVWKVHENNAKGDMIIFDREMWILDLIPEMGFKSLVIALHHLFFSYKL